jgi:hypothetical protein
MSGKSVCLGCLVVGLLGAGMLHGQEPAPVYGTQGPPGELDVAPPPQGGTPGLGEVRETAWVAYPRTPGCCGPVGGHGPIGSEVYVRSGAAFPIGRGIYADALEPGWVIEGGGRVLLFNPEVTAAWTVDLGIRNVNFNNSRIRPATLFNIPVRTGQFGQTNVIPQAVVTLNGLNQTFVNLSLGRTWYLWAPANYAEPGFRNLRTGFDVGGRWGSAKATFNEIEHRDDVIGAFFLAGFADMEFPCGAYIFLGGLRAEYNYTWSDSLQRQNDSDLQTLSILVNFGVRY